MVVMPGMPISTSVNEEDGDCHDNDYSDDDCDDEPAESESL